MGKWLTWLLKTNKLEIAWFHTNIGWWVATSKSCIEIGLGRLDILYWR